MLFSFDEGPRSLSHTLCRVRLSFFFFLFSCETPPPPGIPRMYYWCVLPKEVCSHWSLQTRGDERGEDLVSKFALSRLATLAVSLSPVSPPLFIIFLFNTFLTEREKRKSGMTDFVPSRPIFCILSISFLACTKPKKNGPGGYFCL